jgi:hypothetical protein
MGWEDLLAGDDLRGKRSATIRSIEMLRYDIDGALVWLTREDQAKGKPAIILHDYTQVVGGSTGEEGYNVFYCSPDGVQSDEFKTTKLSEALLCFASRLPADQ